MTDQSEYNAELDAWISKFEKQARRWATATEVFWKIYNKRADAFDLSSDSAQEELWKIRHEMDALYHCFAKWLQDRWEKMA